MAKITFYQDDFDGTQNETVRPRRVVLEEGTLTIDLSDDNYGALMSALEPFMSAGEWTERETGSDDENALIRKWARDNHKDVSPRGRLPKDLVAEYREWQKSQHNGSEGAGNTNADTDVTSAQPTNYADIANSDADNGQREVAASVA